MFKILFCCPNIGVSGGEEREISVERGGRAKERSQIGLNSPPLDRAVYSTYPYSLLFISIVLNLKISS